MVLVAGIGGIFTLGTGLWSISVFVIPMENDLGWSRTTIFGALTVRALVAGALAPLVGASFSSSKNFNHAKREKAMANTIHDGCIPPQKIL